MKWNLYGAARSIGTYGIAYRFIFSLFSMVLTFALSVNAFALEESPVVKMDVTFELTPPDQLKFNVKLEDTTPEAKWSLYVSPFSRSIEQSILVTQDQPVATTEITWSGAELPDGFYHVFGIVKDRNLEHMFFVTEGFNITRKSRPGNRSPFVQLIEPEDTTLFVVGDQVTFEFIAKDLEGDDMTFNLDYKCTGDEAWKTLVAGFEAEEGNNDRLTFDYTFAGDLPTSSKCQIRISANDGDLLGKGSAPNMMALAPNRLTFADMQPLLTEKCAACHTGNNPGGRFRVDIQESIQNPDNPDQQLRGFNTRQNQVIDRINLAPTERQFMPRNGSLTQAQIELFEIYRLSIDD